MPDEATTETTETVTSEATETPVSDVDKWKGHARTWESRAKANADKAEQLESELKKVRESTEAELRGSLSKEFGAKLAVSEIRHEAASRTLDPDALLKHVDVTAFVLPDGNVDTQGLQDWMNSLSPRVDALTPDFGNGSRSDDKSFALNDTDGLLEAFRKAGFRND